MELATYVNIASVALLNNINKLANFLNRNLYPVAALQIDWGVTCKPYSRRCTGKNNRSCSKVGSPCSILTISRSASFTLALHQPIQSAFEDESPIATYVAPQISGGSIHLHGNRNPPGSSVVPWLQNAIISLTPKTIWLVLDSCITTPLTFVWILRLFGSGIRCDETCMTHGQSDKPSLCMTIISPHTWTRAITHQLRTQWTECVKGLAPIPLGAALLSLPPARRDVVCHTVPLHIRECLVRTNILCVSPTMFFVCFPFM
jgi:hypothetical protein